MTSRTLKQLREESGLTQAQLGERLGLTQARVSRIELVDNFRISTLRAYVEALGGKLHLMVRAPDGREFELTIGSDAPPPVTEAPSALEHADALAKVLGSEMGIEDSPEAMEVLERFRAWRKEIDDA